MDGGTEKRISVTQTLVASFIHTPLYASAHTSLHLRPARKEKEIYSRILVAPAYHLLNGTADVMIDAVWYHMTRKVVGCQCVVPPREEDSGGVLGLDQRHGRPYITT